jgi:polar amino acid transport system ATP-binding protein/sulfate transport system ATP-binding protein/NitT/TauT family transport system ATP-binding protein
MTPYSKKEILLQAKDLSLVYGDKCILHDINFSIRDIIRPGLQQGQVVSLVGRSGMGKTQLFRVLSGLQKPSSGSITIRQRKPAEIFPGSIEVYQEMPVRPGDMGVIFQNYYQFGWRTVKQSLLLAARRNKALAGKEEDTLLQYAEQFDIRDVLHRWPSQLSGGQQQRVSIIQQLLKGADFLLLDEPFSGLDICVLDKVVELLLQVSLSDELKTLIIVSHDIATAAAISDTVFILGRQAGKEGSTLVREIDLIERGLAWQKEVRQEKVFAETLEEIKGCL